MSLASKSKRANECLFLSFRLLLAHIYTMVCCSIKSLLTIGLRVRWCSFLAWFGFFDAFGLIIWTTKHTSYNPYSPQRTHTNTHKIHAHGYEQCVQKLLVVSTCALLVMDHRTLQVKYRIPINEIFRLTLSPFMDDIVIVHVVCVSGIHFTKVINTL